MVTIHPTRIYYEPEALSYELGRKLYDKYSQLEWVAVENHNNIPQLRQQPNSAFASMKRDIVVGIRKTLRYVPNHKTSDFLVPYTSSGCAAACLYCYLVCNYNKCSYLRLFVNREAMMDKLIKTSAGSEKELTFEIGSNSDLVLENTVTGNLDWTIGRFGRKNRGYITFPTKFHMVDSLLPLEHNGRVIVRMSVNPREIIKRVEFGTSPLENRIEALISLYRAGYRIGLLIAPVVMLENWKELYKELLSELEERLPGDLKRVLKIEVIFMTYSYVHRKINEEAFPNAVDLYDPERMTGRGMGKYCYRQDEREEGEIFLRDEIKKRLPEAEIAYVV
jgi:spore photoproduct lyase